MVDLEPDHPAMALLALSFVVRQPISTNRVYRRRASRSVPDRLAAALRAAGAPLPGKFGGLRGMYVTPEGKAYQARIVSAATAARSGTHWPSIERPSRVRLSYQLFNYRGDTDGVRKALRDALEGILYANDRIVEDGPAPLPLRDGEGCRLEARVELLGIRSEAEAAARSEASARRKIARTRRASR